MEAVPSIEKVKKEKKAKGDGDKEKKVKKEKKEGREAREEKKSKKEKKDRDASYSVSPDRVDSSAKTRASSQEHDEERDEVQAKVRDMLDELIALREENAELLEQRQISHMAELEKQSVADRTARLIQNAETKARLATLEATTAQEKCALLQSSLDEMQFASQQEYDALEAQKNKLAQENRELMERVRELENSDVRDQLDQALLDATKRNTELEKLRHTGEIMAKETDEFRQEKIDAAVEVHGLTSVGRKLEAHVRVLEVGLQRLADRCRHLEVEKNEAVGEYQNLLAQTQQQRDTWRQSLAESEEKLNLCELAKNQDRVEFNRVFGEQSLEWHQQLDKMQSDMSQAMADRDTFEVEMVEMSDSHTEMKNTMEQKETDIHVLETALEKAEKELEEMTAKDEVSRRNVDELRASLEKQQRMYSESESAVAAVQERCKTLEEAEVSVADLLPKLWEKRLDDLPAGAMKFITEGFLPAKLPALKVWPSAPVPPIPEEWRMEALEEVASLKNALRIALEKQSIAETHLEEARVHRVKAEMTGNKYRQELDEMQRKCDSMRRKVISSERESEALVRFLDKIDCKATSTYSVPGSEITYGSESICRGEAEDLLGDLLKLRDKLEDGGMLSQAHTSIMESLDEPENISPRAHLMASKKKRGMQTHLQSQRTPRNNAITQKPDQLKRPPSQIVGSPQMLNHCTPENRINLRSPPRARGNTTEVAMRGGDRIQSLGDVVAGLNGAGVGAMKLHCPEPLDRSMPALTNVRHQ